MEVFSKFNLLILIQSSSIDQVADISNRGNVARFPGIVDI